MPHYTATSYAYITDYTELVDVGNNFDPKTGVFKINDKDQEGYYVFHINGYRDNKKGKNGSIMVYKNSNWIQGISEGDQRYYGGHFADFPLVVVLVMAKNAHRWFLIPINFPG